MNGSAQANRRYSLCSNYGNIMNADTHKVKQPFRDTDGFRRLYLRTDGKKKSYTVHRLVATYFCDNSGNFSRVQHIDGDRNNNNNSALDITVKSIK